MKINDLLISGFYIGYLKHAPGTIASLVTICVCYLIPSVFIYQIVIFLLFFLSGFYLCFQHSKTSQLKDPSFIVIDEVAGMYLSVFMLPKFIYLYIIAFMLFRCLDIYKPLFIKKSEKFSFGVGIMADDLISGLITVIICWSIHIW